jgi:sugar phosphate permease
MIDTAGYLGAVVAGSAIADVSVRAGWTGAFALLAAIALLSAGAAAAYLFEVSKKENGASDATSK